MSDDRTESIEQSESNPPPMSTTRSMLRGMIGLAIFAVVTAGLIALTQSQTKERIADQVRQAQSRALYEIVPLNEHDNDLLDDAFTVKAEELGLDKAVDAYVARQNGSTVALILPVVAPDGYTAPIRLIVGIDPSGTLKGVRVVQHKETPGLGDKIERRKSDWIDSFVGKSLQNTSAEGWAVKKDGGEFDQLTGATITPRAIVNAVYKALKYFESHQAALLQQVRGAHFEEEIADGQL